MTLSVPLLSRAVARVLTPLVLNPERPFFPRELERVTGEPYTGVVQALSRLLKEDVIEAVSVGGRTGYRANRDNNFYPEFLRVAIKAIGIPEHLDAAGIRSTKIAVFGSFAKGDFAPGSDLDVLVVGDEPLPGAADHALRSVSGAVGRTISVVVVDPKQYRDERDQRSGFVGSVLAGPVVPLRGDL